MKGGFVNDPIGLLKAVGQTVTTNVPRKLLPDLADAATKIGRNGTYRAVITHPLVASAPERPRAARSRSRTSTRSGRWLPTSSRRRHAAEEGLRAPKGSTKVASGSGVSSCGPGRRDAQADPEADEEAHREARHADAVAARRADPGHAVRPVAGTLAARRLRYPGTFGGVAMGGRPVVRFAASCPSRRPSPGPVPAPVAARPPRR